MAAPLQARLGESEAEIETRFGKGKSFGLVNDSDKLKEMHYALDGYDITVIYLNGKSACETYSKYNMTDQDINALLNAASANLRAANNMKPTWSVEDSKPNMDGYVNVNADKHYHCGSMVQEIASAIYDHLGKLKIFTVEYQTFLNSLDKQQKATPSNLKGF